MLKKLTKGARFMSTTMFSAREALIPGSAYDRSKSLVPGPYTFTTNTDFMNPHDTLSYIDPRSRAYNSLNVPIPVPMLMPPVHHQLPHAFFTNNSNSNAQIMNNTNGKKTRILFAFNYYKYEILLEFLYNPRLNLVLFSSWKKVFHLN